MKLYDVCIRGFVKGNLGDDLFIDILCRRYPNTKFLICAEKMYRTCFAEIMNLKYISSDTLVIKSFFRILKIPVWCINKLLLKCGSKRQLPYFGCDQLGQLLSKENVLISGSIFVERQGRSFRIGPYQLNEQKYYRKKPFVIGCNFGPYYNEEYKRFYQECFSKAKQVCFREKYSYELFEGENIQWGPDIVFAYSKDRIEESSEKDYIAISVLNLEKDMGIGSGQGVAYVEAIAGTIKHFLECGENVALVGFCSAQGDDEVIRIICEKCGNDKRILVYNYPEIDYRKMIGVLAGAKAIISTRYHGMILGWLFGKKVLPLVYSDKMQHVIDDVNPKIIACDVRKEIFSQSLLLDSYNCMMEELEEIDVDNLIKGAQIHFKELDKNLS